MNVFAGSNLFDDQPKVFKNGETFSPERSWAIRNHSPDGFNWGYNGSGPAQLALAILLEETTQQRAGLLYQKFKSEVIAALSPHADWQLTSDDVQDWLQGNP